MTECGASLELKLMKQCTGLNRVLFAFDLKKITRLVSTGSQLAKEITKPVSAGSQFRMKMKSIDELVEFYDLGEIFKSGHLKDVLVDGLRDECTSNSHSIGLDRINELGSWIREGFLKRGKSITVHPAVLRSNRFYYTAWD